MLAEQGRWPCATFTAPRLHLFLGQLPASRRIGLQMWLMLASVAPSANTAAPPQQEHTCVFACMHAKICLGAKAKGPGERCMEQRCFRPHGHACLYVCINVCTELLGPHDLDFYPRSVLANRQPQVNSTISGCFCVLLCPTIAIIPRSTGLIGDVLVLWPSEKGGSGTGSVLDHCHPLLCPVSLCLLNTQLGS